MSVWAQTPQRVKRFRTLNFYYFHFVSAEKPDYATLVCFLCQMRILMFLLACCMPVCSFLQPSTLLCDTATGLCIMCPQSDSAILAKKEPEKSGVEKLIRIQYFTDPICSTCWGIEPMLRRLKLEYGDAVHIEYYMGGLLPKWEGFNGGGITKPADVAHHWDEVSAVYQMPIDGNLWLEDPLPSSYPPSVAYKAAALQNEEKAHVFLRRMKEMVFMEKQNIARWPVQVLAALYAGLDTTLLKNDIAGKGKLAFEADLLLARSMNVRGFPTLFLNDADGNRSTVYGYKPYDQMVNALLRLAPALKAKNYDRSTPALFAAFATLTVREMAVLAQITDAEAKTRLEEALAQKWVRKKTGRHGDLYVWNRP